MGTAQTVRDLIAGMKALIRVIEHERQYPPRRGRVLFRNLKAIPLTQPPEFLDMSKQKTIRLRGDTVNGYGLLGGIFTDGAGEVHVPAPGEMTVSLAPGGDELGEIGILEDGRIWCKPRNSAAPESTFDIIASIDSRTDIDDGTITVIVDPDVITANFDGVEATMLTEAPVLAG
jgi:hypothetical protein